MSIVLRNVYKKYGCVSILSNLNFKFDDCGFYAIVGPSGCGKSTLLEMIGGLDTDFKGKIIFNKRNLKRYSEKDLSINRLKNIGYLRQGYDLLDLEKVIENLTLVTKTTSIEKPRLLKHRLKGLSKAFDVDEKFNETANKLSGGQKQRVAFIRSISNSPSVILCDEPTGALDTRNASCIYEKLSSIATKTLVIMVTHDEEAAFQYANCVLRIKNGSLAVEKCAFPDNPSYGIFKVRKRGKIKRISNIFWLKHAFHLCKERKKRTLLSLSALSFSFISLGLASYMAYGISNEINRSLTSIVGKGNFVMERKNADGETIGNTYTAPKNEIENIVENNPEVKDYGTFYFADFDSYFKDLDVAYINNGVNKITLKGLSIRSINEFLWLDENSAEEYYPDKPKILENDQIVLGLPYADMFQLCFQLHILRDYEHLGDYLADKGLNVVFAVSNQDWKYDDEQIVEIKAVVPATVMTIYSYNHRWSEHMYEERMRFPTTDGDDTSLPWLMKKAYYIKPENSGSEMIKQLREDPYNERFIFEPDSYQYDQSHCKIGYACSTRRYYVFAADKSSLSIEDVKTIETETEISSFVVGTTYSYTSFPNNMMTGFSFPFYATNTRDLADLMLDQATNLNASGGISENIPDSVAKGSYLLPASTALTLSNDFQNLLTGRRPEITSEIAISSSLAKKWNNPKTIYLVGLVGQEEIGAQVHKEYRMAEVRVTGIVDDTWDKLYVDSYWPIDFFRDELGMSSFLLEPTKCIFEYGDKDGATICKKLKESFSSYDFTDPSENVAESTEQVFEYLRVSLSLASISCFVLSFMLLFVTVILTILENKREGQVLFLLGLSRGEIERSLDAISLIITLPSSLLGLGIISAMEFFLHRQIGNNFGVQTQFEFSFQPVITILIATLVAYFLIRIYLHVFTRRRDFRKEMKSK